MTGPSERWRQIDDLFDRALDLPAERRATFLDRVCAADPEVRAAVDRLLHAHDRAQRFLEQPAPVFGAPLLADAGSATGALPAGTRIGAYTIIDALGQGGMGDVYRARDERLDRVVALKFLPPDLGADEDARRRLIAEAKLASALDHPGIAVVHDIGETGDGQLFIAMGCYEGETLAAKIARGRLAVAEALELGIQIAGALAAAHRKGIVHRDIKPANVIVTSDGVAKVVDFGIAQIAGASASDSARGTLAYMSPEQLRGDVVDARTDVWSFGVLLYEMLAGSPPFRSDRAGSMIRAIRTGTPAPVASVASGVSSQLDVIVRHCLGKDPASRYRDASELFAALRSVATSQARPWWRTRRAAAAGVIGAVAIAVVIITLAPWNAATPDTPTIAVARFSQHGAGDTARVADALGDMLATNLARVPGLRVVSNARMYEVLAQLGSTGDRNAAWAAAARQAGATELLEGALHRRPDGSLRLDLRRVALRSGAVQDAHTVTGASEFELVDRATAVIAAALRLPGGSLRLADVTTSSLVAYRFYEEGLRSMATGDSREAVRLFEAALAEDSLFAMAAHYLWTSRATLHENVPTTVRAWLLRLAERAADRERLLMRVTWDVNLSGAQSAAIADTLVSRYPDQPDGHLLLAYSRANAGDFLSALTQLERVIGMDSLGLAGRQTRCRACDALANMVSIYVTIDSLAAAERVAREWIRRHPRSAHAWANLATVLLVQDRYEAALEARRTAATLNPADRDNVIFPAMHRIRAGDFDGADRLLRELAGGGTPEIQREALWYLCISLRHQGRLQEALAVLRSSRPRAHDEPALLQHEGQVLFEMGRFADAARRFETSARLRSDPRSISVEARRGTWNLTHLAAVRAAAGDTGSLAALADSIEAWGRHSYFGRDWRLHHHVRGLLLAARGQHEAAAAAFRRAVYSPTSGYTRTNLELARALLELRRPAEAVSVLHSALRGPLEASNLYVTRTELHAALGRAWEAAGRPDSAAFHYRRTVHAWRATDPYLHARRDSVRARLASLGGEG